MIYTIGYEGTSVENFIDEIKSMGIDTVIDVREFPLSRKVGFSKTALHGFVAMAGLEYQHWSVFGCPKPIRNRYKVDADWSAYCNSFNAYLKTQRESIKELAELSQTQDCVLVCFEADYNMCHRKMVAEAVAKEAKCRVEHLSPMGSHVKTGQLSFV